MRLQVRRGLEKNRPKIVPLPDEWCYCTDTQQLFLGDGETPGGRAGQYKGGNPTMYACGVRITPPSVSSHHLIADLVLMSGEIVYVEDEDWWYVGDAKTPGGNKVK